MVQPEIVWEDPPPLTPSRRWGGARNKGWWQERLSALVSRPGQWARVWTGDIVTANVTAAAIRAGAGNGRVVIPEGVWDATVRRLGKTATAAIWVRYLGNR